MPKDVVLITGSSGRIGSALIHRLAAQYEIVGFDDPGPPYPPRPAHCMPVDMESDISVAQALGLVRDKYGSRLASVIHLAGYYSFTGDPDPRYYTVNVLGTRRLLHGLRDFEVEQCAFASSMLVHAPRPPGQRINEDSPLEPKWQYPKSKLETEETVRSERGRVPIVILRIAGVYDDWCHLPALAQQIQRIYERRLISHVFPGDSSRGQAAVHMDDLVEALSLLVERRHALPEELTLLVGEPETPAYALIQNELGRVIHGEAWHTHEIPKTVAKTGAWLQEVALPKEEEPFIKHWMVDIADDHYELDISRARKLLGWEPQRRLLGTLSLMAHFLRQNPLAWYKANKLEAPADLEKRAAPPKPDPACRPGEERPRS